MTTITVDRAVLEQVLEALEPMQNNRDDTAIQRAITALRAALAQQEEDIAQNLKSRLDAALLLEERRQEVAQPRRETEQEPVAWVNEASIAWLAEHPRGIITTRLVKQKSPERQMAMYAEPPRREWQSLSEEEINELSHTMVKGHKSVNWLARAIEAALKEKNHE